MATRPKVKKMRAQRRTFLSSAHVTKSVKAISAAPKEVTFDVPRNHPPHADTKNSASFFDVGPEALRAHLAHFRDDLMRLDEFLAARRMTRLLRDFDYLTRALLRSRV